MSRTLSNIFEKDLKYIKHKYGHTFDELNGLSDEQINFSTFINNFTETNIVADVSSDGSANVGNKDIATLLQEAPKSLLKELAFNKIHYEMAKKYGREIAFDWLEAEWNGTFYLHNSHTSTYIPYCFAYSLKDVVEKGLFFLGNFKSSSAQHLDTYNNHILEFLSYTTNRTSGAAGIPDFLLYSFYFFKKDRENKYLGITDWDGYMRQHFQSFIYNINQPYLRVIQPSFVNVSIFDKDYYYALFGSVEFPDGTLAVDYVDEFMEYQKVFMEVVSKIRQQNLFTYPVLTYALLWDKKNEKFADEEFAKWCNRHNDQWYDSNFFVSDDINTLSSCCRILNNFEEIEKKKKTLGFINSIGGTSLSIGSVQVNTINLNRIALLAKQELFNLMVSSKSFVDYDQEIKKLYKNILKKYAILNLQALDTIRNIITRNIEKGLLPIYEHKLIQLENQYNTLGVFAMYDAIKTLGYLETDDFSFTKYSDKGMEFSKEILDFLNDIKEDFSSDKSYLINIESVPGEKAAIVLNKKDRLLYGMTQVDSGMYANQWIALTEKCSMDEKIKLSSVLDKKVGGKLRLPPYTEMCS